MQNYTQLIEEIQKIHDAFVDEESKEIYQGLYQSLLTGETKSITQSISNSFARRMPNNFIDLLLQQKQAGKKLVIFCAGLLGKHLLTNLQDVGISVDAISDNNSTIWESTIKGVPVISPQTLYHWHGNAFIVISTNITPYLRPIEQQLSNAGFLEGSDWISTKIFGEMYFPDFLQFSLNEVFADCGAFNGDESFTFANKTNHNYRHIYLIEPEHRNMELCKQRLANLSKIEFIEACVMDTTGEIGFSASLQQNSKVDLSSKNRVCAFYIDDKMQALPPTYIKMDLEGFEYLALSGASKIIKKFKPKLAVSIYHKQEDIFELPALLLRLNPSYQLFLRHYSFCHIDTVLYAIP